MKLNFLETTPRTRQYILFNIVKEAAIGFHTGQLYNPSKETIPKYSDEGLYIHFSQ